MRSPYMYNTPRRLNIIFDLEMVLNTPNGFVLPLMPVTHVRLEFSSFFIFPKRQYKGSIPLHFGWLFLLFTQNCSNRTTWFIIN
jgi:hypothetical protein